MAAHFATGDLVATCRLCAQDDAYRRRWACDGPQAEAVYAIPCPRCDGAAAGCTRCGESGEELIYECPRRSMPRVFHDVIAAVLISEAGPWPEAGGLNDQPLWFVAAREFVLRIVGEWRQRAAKAASAGPHG